MLALPKTENCYLKSLKQNLNTGSAVVACQATDTTGMEIALLIGVCVARMKLCSAGSRSRTNCIIVM